MARNNEVITDKELEVRIFNTFVKNTFVSGENYVYTNGVSINEPVRYLLGPSFYFYKNNFYSNEYPVINAVFESFLQKVKAPDVENAAALITGGLARNDVANLILKEKSLNKLLAENPGFDTIRIVLSVKGNYLFNLMREKAGIAGFNSWFTSYLNQHRFESIDITKFDEDLKLRFGFGISSYMNDWYNNKDQPGFLFTDFKVSEIIVDGRSRFQVSFIASNPESVAGVFNITFRTSGTSGQAAMGITMNYSSGDGTAMQVQVQGSGMQSDNIDRVIYLDGKQAKKIGVVLDAQPREMVVNTLYSKNIPGEISFPFFEIEKARKGTDPFIGEVVTEFNPLFTEPNEIVVDNEDPGFTSSQINTSSPLKKLLGIENISGATYEEINYYRPSEIWQPIVLTTFYGKYIRSAVYTKAGTGDKSVVWATPISDPGYYEVYCYMPKITNLVVRRGQESESMVDLHFRVYNDEGVENITLDYKNAEEGWNNLGSFYLTGDSAKVEMTNSATGRIVLGDAVKWVKQN